MDQGCSFVARGSCRCVLIRIIVLGAVAMACGFCMAADESLPPPSKRGDGEPQLSAAPKQSEPSPSPSLKGRGTSGGIRSDGVFDESYFGQLHRPMQSYILGGRIPQANGWYNYGFPMQTYRWGWFGAERPHYPRILWHQRYYGDKTRTAYRYGH